MSDRKPPKTRLRIPGLAMNEEDARRRRDSTNPPDPEPDDQRYHISKKTRLGINPEFVLADDSLELVEEVDDDDDDTEAVGVVVKDEPGGVDAQVAGDISVVGGETEGEEREPVTMSIQSIEVKEIESVSYDMNVHDTVAMPGFDPNADDDLETRPTVAVGFRPAQHGVVAPTMKVSSWDPLPQDQIPHGPAQQPLTSNRTLVIAITVVSAVLFAIALYAYLS